ncbi:hypothetical protein [Rhodothermus marinus]|uniref:hypothetical protein n=1 Tax=Rhodothermus marinus TaxID=29549 RepID=UPI000B03A6D9|nr:hypothetical protein [Rhodothermus marinus]
MWLPGRNPAEVAPEELTALVPPVRTFEGFAPEAFEALARLKSRPHIEQYRQEKPALRRYVQEPFRRLRDDLVVNWVLPNSLALETERNVFSRFLKNDFGAGGCYAHYWMAFYRQGRRRLADVQLIVSLHADGLRVGVYAGERRGRSGVRCERVCRRPGYRFWSRLFRYYKSKSTRGREKRV